MAIALPGLRVLAFAAALTLAAAANAVTQVKIDLGPPIINGTTAQMDVTLDFLNGGDASAGVTFVQIAATNSSASLTAGGTDYSRFSFTPGAALASWDFFAGFGPSAIENSVSYSAPFPLNELDSLKQSGNTHVLGTLNVNLAGLVAGSVHQVDIGLFSPSDTTAFYLSFATAQGVEEFVDQFDDDSITVRTLTVPQGGPEVPEPASLSLIALSAAGLLLRRVRRNQVA